ncbi:divalent-cation tolerance protein CutA [Campylobacter geochelonis]|uniref:divalent-cation tolerance protein CutA n=1 Tax=Campylobacter geochelonis TaxID=1780362 RepID=UPI000770760C|nr:threonine synthase [Campylobacter geochelonis]CZE50117.1 threonine synthase [Campylobacter geochelonis]
MVVFCTVDDKKIAKFIAKSLVEKSLAACVNIIKNVDSIYLWDSKICKSKEYQLMIKSTKKNFKAIENEILKLHPYDTPEIFSLKFDKINKKYKKWIQNSINKDKK